MRRRSFPTGKEPALNRFPTVLSFRFSVLDYRIELIIADLFDSLQRAGHHPDPPETEPSVTRADRFPSEQLASL